MISEIVIRLDPQLRPKYCVVVKEAIDQTEGQDFFSGST
ncbi:hypothetical protein U2F10_01665 [Leptothoe sp. EHU-05/26/07-4]